MMMMTMMTVATMVAMMVAMMMAMMMMVMVMSPPTILWDTVYYQSQVHVDQCSDYIKFHISALDSYLGHQKYVFPLWDFHIGCQWTFHKMV